MVDVFAEKKYAGNQLAVLRSTAGLTSEEIQMIAGKLFFQSPRLFFKKEKPMENKKVSFTSIDEYIATFPAEIQKILEEIRATIKAAAPEAEEKISYQMPTFFLNCNLVHFAAFKKHIGFYPVPTGIEKFKKELSAYEGAKGSVQFPLDKPMPYALITKIVKFRVKENLAKAEIKEKKKKTPAKT